MKNELKAIYTKISTTLRDSRNWKMHSSEFHEEMNNSPRKYLPGPQEMQGWLVTDASIAGPGNQTTFLHCQSDSQPPSESKFHEKNS